MRLKECDTVFLLDIPTELCIEGAKARIGQKRNDLPWVEQELDKTFEQNIIKFSNDKLPKIYELLEQYKKDKSIIIFKSREEIDKYIKNLENK